MGRMVVLCLSEAAAEGVKRFFGDRVDALVLSEDKQTGVVTITRTGKFYDPRYGEFEITREMLLSMVRNFDSNVYGQKIALDVAHKPQDGAAGFFKRVFLDGNKLRGEVEFTEYGVEAVQKRGCIYLSAEFADNYRDNEQRKEHGPTLLGAALTPRPVIKRLDPVQLSEDALDGVPTYLSERVKQFLSEDLTMNLKELMEQLRKKLSEFNLAEMVVAQLLSTYEAVATKLATPELQRTLMTEFVTQGQVIAKTLTEAGTGNREIKLDLSGLENAVKNLGSGLSADDVRKLMAEERAEDEKRTKQLAEKRDGNVKLFTDAIDGAEGLKALSEDQRKKLLTAAELITPDMTPEQVKKFADHQISLGNDMAVSSQLGQIGWRNQPAGSVHITVDESNKIKSLQETVDRRLGILDQPDSRRYARTGGSLQPENKALAEKTLAIYDSLHAAQLHAEAKMLAGGDGIVSDVAVPASFERAVIREALYSIIGLQFVDVGALPFASSHVIPYSYRDTTAAGKNSTRKYEGQAIARAGVIQTSETAYPIPQKLAFEVSDELRYLTTNGQLNWEALAENQRNATRIIAEDTEQLIFNEVLKASDEYGAVAVSNEDLEPQADGTDTIFVLAHFPVVRPRKVYDSQGNQVGNTANPIVVTYNAVALSEYDGTGTQANGTYYVLDYNLGEIYLVNQAGAVQTPANGTAYTISYSYATNVYAFDTDEGSTETAVHWDGFLYRFGLRKAVIEDDRYHMPNLSLMSGTVQNQIEQARKFAANFRVPGTELSANGNVGRIKDLATFKTSAPGLHMGDQRVVIGERGITRYRMSKPWEMGQLENQKDSNGRFTGKKEAYGDQFVFLHTPTQLKRAYTSMVLYSATARVAR